MVNLREELTTGSGRFIRFEIENGFFYIVRGQGGTVHSRDKLRVESALTLANSLMQLVEDYEDETGDKLSDSQKNVVNYEDMSEQELVSEMADIFNELPDKPRYRGMIEAFNGEDDHYSVREDFEKTREQVLQLTYEEFGEEFFTSREFRDLYNSAYDRGEWSTWVRRLKGNYFKRESVDSSEVEDGRIRYKYKLTEKVLQDISDYGSLTSDDHPAWSEKKMMLNPDLR